MPNNWARVRKQPDYAPPPPEIQRRVQLQLGENIWSDVAARFDQALGAANDPGAQLSSWWRSATNQAAQIARGRTTARASQHLVGLATDVIPSSVEARDRLYNALRERGFYVIPEVRGGPRAGQPTTLSAAGQLHVQVLSPVEWQRSPLSTYARELLSPLIAGR